MTFIRRAMMALVAPLLLTGCLWSPGKFESKLTVGKNGRFQLDYRGEILFAVPEDDPKPSPWTDDLAHCKSDGTASLDLSDGEGEDRECTAAELARLRDAHASKEAERIAAKRKENEEMARVLGLPGSDDASSRKFAETVRKYAGWRSVTYKGKGVYDVDYSFSGTLGQDFAFPMMPDSDLVLPFIAIRRRADGTVMVNAPAFAGGEGPFASRAKLLGLPGKDQGGDNMKAEGRFTLVTDGEVLTNNSADGPVVSAEGRTIVWDVSPSSTRTPEALIRL
jgi:hypothetical protein